MNDESYVIVRHLLRYASCFDASEPVLLGHALDKKVFGPTRTFGRCGMLHSRAALARFGGALSEGGDAAFGVPNDQNIVHRARRIGVRLLCTPTRSLTYLARQWLSAPRRRRRAFAVGARWRRRRLL